MGKFTCRICLDSKYRQPRHILQHEASQSHKDKVKYHLLLRHDARFQGSTTPADALRPLGSAMATSYRGILENLAATIPPDADREDVQMADESAKDPTSDTSSPFHPGFDWNDVDMGRLEDSAQAKAVAEYSRGILQYINGETAWPDDEDDIQREGSDWGGQDDEPDAGQDSGEQPALEYYITSCATYQRVQMNSVANGLGIMEWTRKRLHVGSLGLTEW